MTIRFLPHAIMRFEQRFAFHLPELLQVIKRWLPSCPAKLLRGQRERIYGYVRLRNVRVVVEAVDEDKLVVVSAMWMD
jgi:hypothetical protein